MNGAGQLDRDAINAIFAPLSGEPGLLLAVSGGPDSTALLLMAALWAKQKAAPRLYAATVDHGLRREGADEAAAVANLAKTHGIAHKTLRWEGDKPTTRVQERAREARYRLLGAHAAQLGLSAVVTAHHLDDQAETVLFRLARGSGIAGLAGMASRSQRDGVTIFRPLLAYPKSALVAFCEREGIAYASDPSNEDLHYARPRLRKLMLEVAREGLDAPTLARLARRAALVEEALIAQTIAAEKRLGLVATGACDASALFAEPFEIARRLLTLAFAAIGGEAPERVSLEKMEALTAALRDAGRDGRIFSANVAGARVVCNGKGRLQVGKEPPRRALIRKVVTLGA